MSQAATLELVHDPATNRIDAKQVSSLLNITPTELAEIIKAKPASLRRRPQSESYQEALAPLVQAWDNLRVVFPNDQAIRNWMRHPIKRLQGKTPLWLLHEHGVASFSALVDELTGESYP
ncbi:DUF2384 domain-containing protein [bacterium]|nr:MAG: DUF2384 domain-containing protein [bacterium]